MLGLWIGELFGYGGQSFMLSLSFDPPNRDIPSAGTSVPRSQEVCNISVTFQVSVGAQVHVQSGEHRYIRLSYLPSSQSGIGYGSKSTALE